MAPGVLGDGTGTGEAPVHERHRLLRLRFYQANLDARSARSPISMCDLLGSKSVTVKSQRIARHLLNHLVGYCHFCMLGIDSGVMGMP
jgi:hypothetical protein